jgi:hypothetical protein
MKKYLLYVTTSVVALTAIGALAFSAVSAAAPSTTHINPMATLVNALAQRFNLSPTDVQKVFDDQKAQMQSNMQRKTTDRINQAVTAGKLTQDQATKILAKQAELQAQEASFKASLQGKTKAEIQAALKAHMDALQQWAKDNNIPMQYLVMRGFKGIRGGFGHHLMMPGLNK